MVYNQPQQGESGVHAACGVTALEGLYFIVSQLRWPLLTQQWLARRARIRLRLLHVGF